MSSPLLAAGAAGYRALVCAVIAAALTVSVPVYAAAGPSSAARSVGPLVCRQQVFPVVLVPGVQTKVSGTLCARGNPTGRTVLDLEPGATYDETYYNFPYQPQTYSFVDFVTRLGYASLDLNRPGTVPSDGIPPAADVTIQSDAAALHQVIQDQHQEGYRTIDLVGHSVGSYVAMYEAGTWHDVHAVVLTGALHQLNPAGTTEATDNSIPAAQDPSHRFRVYPAGYITTRPGTRGTVFYAPGDADTDPTVIRVDEATKSVATVDEIVSIDQVAGDVAVSQAISVPVFLVVGQDDQLNCNQAVAGLSCADSAAVLAREDGDYGPAAHLSAFVLPQAGHDVFLEENAPMAFRAIADWLGSVGGPH
jgi:alpha-beta hydrolase superfamily lysophospholipase